MAVLIHLYTKSVYAMHFMCLYTFDTDTVIVLEALVHEEVSYKTLRCLHDAKYQCTANQ